MADLNIRLDMDRIQSSVNAAIRPAVESALASVDLKKMIEEELLRPGQEVPGPYDLFLARRYEASQRTLLEELVSNSIAELARQYVERELRAQKEAIEDAFRRMFRDSNSSLAQAFAAAATRALDAEGWSFELDVTVKHSGEEEEG